MSVSKISEVLKRLLFEHDLKVVDLARMTNVPQPTVQRLVSGTSRRPHDKSLIPIANYFKISLDQLKGEMPITNLRRAERTLEELGMHRLPRLNWSQIDDWLTTGEYDSNLTKTIVTDAECGPRSFALTARDASMDPMFPAGTLLVFDPDCEAKDRFYVLAKLQYTGEPLFRQLLIDGGYRFVKPLSPDLEHFRMQLLEQSDQIIAVLVEAKFQYNPYLSN